MRLWNRDVCTRRLFEEGGVQKLRLLQEGIWQGRGEKESKWILWAKASQVGKLQEKDENWLYSSKDAGSSKFQ